MAVIARDITDRVARSASCSACSRSSRPPAARARPRTPACGCWPTPARCSSAPWQRRRAAGGGRAARGPHRRLAARWTSSISPGSCAAPAPTRARPTAARGCSPWRATRRSRAPCRPTSRSSSRTPASAAIRARTQRDARPARGPRARRRRALRSAGATPGAGPRATSGASSRRSPSASRSPSTARCSTASARTWPRPCRQPAAAALPDIPGATVAARVPSPRARGWTSAATSTTSSPSTTGRGPRHRRRPRQGRRGRGVTALARYTVRAVAGRSPSPAETLAALNDEMLRQRNPDRRFVTAVLVRLEPRAEGGARSSWPRGGHPPPVLLRAGGGRRGGAVPGHAAGRRGRRAQLSTRDRAGRRATPWCSTPTG